MKTVRHILKEKGSQLYSVTPETHVFDALKVMADHDIGAVAVMENDRLAGIFSERDYARKVILLGKSSRALLVREVMTSEVITVKPQETVAQCMALMNRKHIRHLPVLEDQQVVGMISMRDVVQTLLSEQEEALERLEKAVVDTELFE
jgi:CBS domain-containing protein